MEIELESFDQDLLNRKPLAENLMKIIENANEMNVIALDSSWGTGKTTFLKMWNNMINNEENYKDKYETLYFNAWENDYIKDPLLALISVIEQQVTKNDSKPKKGLAHIKEYGKKIIKPTGKTIIKLLTKGILDLDKIKFEESNEEEIIKLIGEIGELSIKEIVKEKEHRSEFINKLKEYVQDNNINIIFFIDELDRCRPSFAIELLEVIKHIFNINKITFVISIDKEQLAYSISTLYGQGMDSDGYLRRFFDLEYKMPITDKKTYIEYKNNIYFNNYKNTEFLGLFLRELFIRDVYSFRDIDKSYNYLKLILPTIKEFNNKIDKGYQDIYLIVFNYLLAEFINIKVKHSEVYKNIINLNYSENITEIREMLKFNDLINLKFNSKDISNDGLREIINVLLEKYLRIIKLRINNLQTLQDKYDEFNISPKKNGYCLYGEFNMLSSVIEGNLDFISKMEFVDCFL